MRLLCYSLCPPFPSLPSLTQMYGSMMGTLNVDLSNGTHWETAWSRAGNQGNYWQAAFFSIPERTIKFRFSFITGSGFKSDVAIDDVLRSRDQVPTSIPTPLPTIRPTTETFVPTPEPTQQPSPVPTFPQQGCDFDSGLCGFSMPDAGAYTWIRKYGSTDSPDTGPSGDHTGNGAYVYTEASYPNAPYKGPFVLETDIGDQFSYVQFYYHVSHL